jgi:hypothetical protein
MPTTDSYAVPKDVWDTIVPEARETDARERRVTGWVVAASVALVVASWFATQSGFFGPRLTSSSSSESQADAGTHSGQITLDIVNTGHLGTRITGARLVTAGSSSVQVTAIRPTPDRLGGGDTGTLTISYTVTNCDADRAIQGADTGPADPSLTSSETIEVEGTTWWGGTRAVALQPIGAIVGDLVALACTPASTSSTS